MLKDISKGWNSVQAISWVVCPGSWYALKTLTDRELLPWLKPEYVSWFGFPLLIIFCASCLFGLKGLVSLGLDMHTRWKNLEEIEKKYKAQHRDVDEQFDNQDQA